VAADKMQQRNMFDALGFSSKEAEQVAEVGAGKEMAE
jgi:hypothetical protein